MSLSAICPNGHAFSVSDELAGKRVRCPTCRALAAAIPAADGVGDLEPCDLPLEDTGPETDPLPKCPNCGAGLIFEHRDPADRLACPSCHLPLLTLAADQPAAATGLTLVDDPANSVAAPQRNWRMVLAMVGFGVGMGMLGVALLVVGVLWLRSSQDAPAVESTSKVVALATHDQNHAAVDVTAAQAAATRRNAWRDIGEVARRSKGWLYVHLSPGGEGSRTARVRNASGDGQFPEFSLADGEGVPLFEYQAISLQNRGWSNAGRQPSSVADRKVLQHIRETDLYRICKLSDFGSGTFNRGEDDAQNFDHRHVWSPDGNYLYVLSRQQRGSWQPLLRKVNTQTWEVELELALSEEVGDFAWTAQGLVLVCDSVLGDRLQFTDSETWVRLYPSNQQLQSHRGGIFLLDPDTLSTRRGWVTPRVQEVAGLAGSDLIYVRNPQNALMTINVKTGELLSCYAYQDLLGDDGARTRRDDLHFLHPQLAADGRSLTTHGMNNVVSPNRIGASALGPRSVNRFLISGASIEWEQSQRVGGLRSRFTRRCDVGVGEDYLCLPDQRFEIVPVNALSDPLARLSLPPDTAIAVDSASNTVFLCWPDWPAKQLTFRMLRGTTDTEVTLSDGLVPAREPARFSQSRFPAESRIHHNLWPFEMSAAPNGRGAIVFTPEAAYWIEPKFGGTTQWAFNAELREASGEDVEGNADDPGQAGPRSTAARGWAETLTRCKAATALVLVPSQDKFGSAFCVDEQGYFLTNVFHVEGLEVDSEVSLIVQAGSFRERATTATVVRVNPEVGVALLKTEPHADLVPISLGEDQVLTEAEPLTAFGYTRAPEQETNAGRYPSVGAKPGVATALRRTETELVAIQFNGVLLPGNSGGPVVDSTGHVIGIALSGIEMLGLNFLVPASRLKQLAWPELNRAPQIVHARPGWEQRRLMAQTINATALVVLPNQQGFGSAFCIDQRGYFATNAHVVEGVRKSEVVTLVLHAGEAGQRLATAHVVRTMRESDLALLKLDDPQPDLVALEIDEATELAEQMEVTALGFPFGDALAVSAGQFPSVSVNVASIEAVTTTTLGHTAFEFHTQLNPGNSGGSVVAANGKVVGVVFATQLGARKSYAIPAARLRELMFNPSFAWKVPAVEYADRRQETALSVIATPYLRSLDGLELSLTLTPEYGPEQVYPMSATDEPGTYEVRAPLIAAEVPDYVQATFDFATGSIAGVTEDYEVQLGQRSARLSTLPDGATFDEQEISGLEQIVVDTGGGRLHIDCSAAIGATIEPFRPSFVAYAITAHQDGREVVGQSGKIAINLRQATEVRKHHFGKQLAQVWSEGPPHQGLPPFKVTARYEGGSIVGLAEDRRFKVIRGSAYEEYDLHDVNWIKFPPAGQGSANGSKVRKYHLNLTGDGRVSSRGTIGSQLQGLEQVPMQVGLSDVEVDLTAASEVYVEPLDNAMLKRLPLASPITEVAAGGGGRWLILQLPEFGRLVVFDVHSRRVVHNIPLVEERVLFAAGSEKLLLVFPELKSIERWDLASGRRELTAEFSLEGSIGAVAMGCGGSGPLLMHGYHSDEAHQPVWILVDPHNLHTTRLDARLPEATYPTSPPLAASVSGKVFGSLDLALILNGPAADAVAFHATADVSASTRSEPSLVVPGASGQQLFYRNALYSAQGETLGGEPEFFVGLPGYDEEYCLRFQDTRRETRAVPQVILCENKAATLRPLVALDTFRFQQLVQPRDSQLPLRKRFHLYPELRLLISIPPSNDVLLFNELPAWK